MAVNNIFVKCFVGFLVVWGFATAETRRIYDQHGLGYLRRAIVVDHRDFEVPKLRLLSEAFVKEALQYRFASLRIVTEDRFLDLGRIMRTHAPYVEILETARQMAGEPFEYAEAIVIEENAVLRIRMANGESGHFVLRGSDPLALKLRSGQGRIVWIEHWREGPPPRGVESGLLDNLAVFVSTPKLNRAFSEEALPIIKARVPHLDFNMWVNSSAWFPFVEWSPLVNPFEQLDDAHATSRKLGLACNVGNGAVECKELSP